METQELPNFRRVFQTIPGSGGPPTLKPHQADIRLQDAEDVKEFESLRVFAGKFHEMPFENVTKQRIKGWRPAGFFAQRKAAAATGFVLNYAREPGGLDMEALRSVWAGSLSHFQNAFLFISQNQAIVVSAS